MISPRPELEAVATVAHGSTHRPDLADFSSSVIPLDLPLVDLFSRANIFRYPDTTSRRFREVVSQVTGTTPEWVVAGNGASELFFMLALGFFSKNTRVGVVQPTFGEYERVARIMGAKVETFALRPEESFALDPERLSRWIDEQKISALFLCNPNNPTGFFVGFDAVMKLARTHPETLVVVDLAYVDYVGITLPYCELLAHKNVVLVHSLTKAFGIAGLRSGFALASPDVATTLDKVRVPWNMNALAQVVSGWLLENRERFAPVVAAYRTHAKTLAASLQAMGYRTLPSTTDYFMVEVPDSVSAKESLLSEGFLVRELASMGCPHHIRVNVCEPAVNARFAEAFARVIPLPA